MEGDPGMERAGELRRAVQEKYRDVAECVEGHFPYPVGRASALGLGYAEEWLDAIPASVVERFVGVGCPLGIRTPESGERVLDLGCGAGLDTFVAALLVGAKGRAVGLDLTPEMLAWARRAAAGWAGGELELFESAIEALPFAAGSFDVVTSNGVLNLVPDKDAAFRGILRVLKPGGTFVAADLLVTGSIPPEVLASMDAWST